MTMHFLLGLRPVPSANDPRQKGPADTKGRDVTALPAGWTWACTNRGSAVGPRPAVETSVVCIGVGSCVLPNVPAEARARLQRCSRLTREPDDTPAKGRLPTSEPLNVPWWSDSLATPAGSLDAEARAASHGYKAACNCRRVFQIRRYTPPGDVPAAAVGSGVLSTPEKGLSHNRMDGAKVGPQRGQMLASP